LAASKGWRQRRARSGEPNGRTHGSSLRRWSLGLFQINRPPGHRRDEPCVRPRSDVSRSTNRASIRRLTRTARRDPITALLVLAVLTWSCITVVSAAWVQPLTIEGSVTTAGFDAQWFFRSCDTEPPDDELADWAIEPTAGDQTGHSVTLSIADGYPGYELYCEIHIANTGDIAATISDISATQSHAEGVQVTAESADPDKEIHPCPSAPSWGTRPNNVHPHCRAEIQVRIVLLDDAPPVTSVSVGVVLQPAT